MHGVRLQRMQLLWWKCATAEAIGPGPTRVTLQTAEAKGETRRGEVVNGNEGLLSTRALQDHPIHPI